MTLTLTDIFDSNSGGPLLFVAFALSRQRGVPRLRVAPGATPGLPWDMFIGLFTGAHTNYMHRTNPLHPASNPPLQSEVMVEFESCGIPTRFPHNAHLYRLLLSKATPRTPHRIPSDPDPLVGGQDWMKHACLMPGFHAPATTNAPRAVVAADKFLAADMVPPYISMILHETYMDVCIEMILYAP